MDNYLIWSNYHRSWWMPNANGYTLDVGQAGRFSRQYALTRCAMRDQVPGDPLPELPIREDDLLSVFIPANRNPSV